MSNKKEQLAEKREELASRRFFAGLQGIASLRTARRFAEAGPLQSDPGGLHYTHLGHFLYWVTAKGFTVPEHLSDAEKQAFCGLLKRATVAGEVREDALPRLEAEILKA
jgi:hypothetical protein